MNLATFALQDWVAIGSAALALASLVLNWLIVRRQTELQFEELRAHMDAEVLAWAQEAIDAVSAGAALARARGQTAPAEFHTRALDLSQRCAALADRGRLFFPNVSPQDHGVHKEAAFQGYRQPILDAVVFACGRLERIDPHEAGADTDAAEFLVKCRRLLVSEAQNAIDPRRRAQMLRRLAIGRGDDKKSAFAVASELGFAMEGLYPGYLDRPRGPDWVKEREALSRRVGKRG
jgi:hypothetical protein